MSAESAIQAMRDGLKDTIAQAHAMWATNPGSSEDMSRRLSEDGKARVVNAREVERSFGPAAARAWQLLRAAKGLFLDIATTPDAAAAAADLLDRIGAAIEAAGHPGREGPYGLFDYSRHEVEKPYRVRDFRDRTLPSYGATIFQSDDHDEAQAHYDRLTRRHMAEAALRVLPGDAAPARSPTTATPGVAP